MTWWWLALAGGLGAWARFRLDTWIRDTSPTSVPTGTLTINLVGALALGVLSGWASHHSSGSVVMIIGTGLLGGFTTFSTAMVEWVNLVQARQVRPAALLVVAMIGGGLAAALLGVAIGRALP